MTMTQRKAEEAKKRARCVESKARRGRTASQRLFTNKQSPDLELHAGRDRPMPKSSIICNADKDSSRKATKSAYNRTTSP